MLTNEPLRRFPGTSKDHGRVVHTVCQECSVGCGLLAYVKDERIVDLQGDETCPVNRGRLCAKGMAFMQGLTHPDRITLPATRNRLHGPFEAMDNWEKGLDLLAERLKRVRDQHGPEALIVGCDPEAGFDFLMGARRFARLWGTPHVYSPLEEPPHASLSPREAGPSASSDDWLNSRTLLLVEADLAATHPVAFRRILEAQRRGTKIVAADTRFTATMSKADVAVVIQPHSGNRLGLVLMKMLLEEKRVDLKALENCFGDPQNWQSTFNSLSLDGIGSAIGPKMDDIRHLALLLGHHQPATLITAKRLAYAPHYGVWLTMARAMGWEGTSGGGWYPLESGGPALDPCGDLEDAAAKGREETVGLSPSLGVFPYQMSVEREEALSDLKAKALIGSGNCLSDFLAPCKPLADDMDLVVYFGSFPNRTREMAHMVFPAVAWAESDGLSFNNDGAIQWHPKVVQAGDACRSGLGFWIRLAQRFGWEEYFPWQKEGGSADHQAFYQWLLKANKDTADLEFDHLLQDDRHLFWQKKMRPSEKADIHPLAAPKSISNGTATDQEDAYPLYFQATRVASRTGNSGQWWTWTFDLEPEDTIQIHPCVAAALEIENGASVRVVSADEIIEGLAWINRMVPPWLVWSSRRMQTRRVLIHRKGQSPEEACEKLKATQR
jgi:anaerobic selenocysteine-containing dehydrogenase